MTIDSFFTNSLIKVIPVPRHFGKLVDCLMTLSPAVDGTLRQRITYLSLFQLRSK